MSISYTEGAKCLLRHCHNLYEGKTKCKKKYVRCTLLSIHTGGVTRIFSQVSGPSHKLFKCTNQQKNCDCMHAEMKIINDAVATLEKPSVMQHILLCSYSPCTRCANAIIYSELINAVIYAKVYEYDTGGLSMLEEILPTFTVEKLKEIANGVHHNELSFIKRWSS